ncbi:MAG: methionine synthase [Chloroflexi bacterium]|nr:methionine synthase [Chloroflexota bacterium]
MDGLWTTAVGSYPKPPYLLEARTKYARKQISRQELEELEKQATSEWIEFQESIGMDILVDGEQYRGDMVAYFAENLEGFADSGLVRSYGNRYYRKPVAVGPVRRREPVTVEMFKYAQNLTRKPVKGMLTGPYTICDWSFDNYYGSREKFIMALADFVHEEAMDLERAGAKYIQIDEPAVPTRPEEIEIAIKAMQRATEGLKAHTITHMCYGDFTKIYPRMLHLAVDQIDLEMTNSNYDLLDVFRASPFTKEIGLGVLDVHSHVIETKEAIKAGIRKALELLPPDRIYVDPDCGLKTRTVEESKAKLSVMQEAVNELKAELGLRPG